MVDPKDAEGITVPICMLASGDEDKEAVAGFAKNLKVKNHVETYHDQVHVSHSPWFGQVPKHSDSITDYGWLRGGWLLGKNIDLLNGRKYDWLTII